MEENKNLQKQGADKSAAPKKERPKLMQEISAMDGGQLWDYALKKVIIPYTKKAIIEILNTYFFNSKSVTSGTSKTSVEEPYKDYTTPSSVQSSSLSSRSVFDYEKISYDRYDEAESVLNDMRETLARYGRVRVSEMWELSKKSPSPNDYRWGWKSLEGASVVTLNGEKGIVYKISLPKAIYLD